MKNHLTVLFAALCAPWCACYAGQVDLCTTTQSFSKSCTTGQQCCPNNNYMLAYSCPSGWAVSGTTCVRTGISGSDDTGYYTQNYGTCAATSTQQQCCDVSIGTSAKCMQCIGSLI